MYYWNPQRLKELKERGYKLHAAPEAKLQASSVKQQATEDTSNKPQATSIKLQAASNKLLDNLSLIKFHVSRSEVLHHDKCILRMFHMEGYLVWRKCHTITLRYFQLYSEKMVIYIVSQQIRST